MIIYIYSYILKENLIERVFETEVCFWMGGGGLLEFSTRLCKRISGM